MGRLARPVVVVGSLNMDLVVGAERAPRAGETVPATAFATFAGGKGLNQAVAARRAGATVALIGRLGADDMGGTLRRQLAQEGIDAQGVAEDPAGTGIAVVVVERDGGNRILVVPRANGAVGTVDVDAAVPKIAAAGVLVLQGEVPLAASLRAARVARGAGVPVLYNPAPVPPPSAELDELLALAAFVVPNEGELAALAGAGGERGARRLRRRTAGPVVATLAERGALLAESADSLEVLPSFPVAAVDTVGAGDAFVGAFAAAQADGVALRGAVRWGLAAGALACTRAGALPSMPRKADIAALVANRSEGAEPGPPGGGSR